MHYTVGVIIPVQDSRLLDSYDREYQTHADQYHELFAQKLRKPLERWNLERDVVSHKAYIDAVQVTSMHKHYKTSKLEELVDKMPDWNGDQGGGIDENGLYSISTRNLDGKYDYWSVFGVLRSEFLNEHLEEDRIPHAMITPDLKWIEEAKDEIGQVPNRSTKMDQWVAQIRALLTSYPNSLVILVDCHM